MEFHATIKIDVVEDNFKIWKYAHDILLFLKSSVHSYKALCTILDR